MSIQKSELQAAMANNIGASIEDRLESVQNEIQQYDGAHQALAQAMKSLEGLFKHVDQDVDEGKYADLEGPLQIAGAVKNYIKKAIGLVDNLATSSKIQGIRARGKAEGVQDAMTIVKKVREQAEAKVRAAMRALGEGQVEVETEGGNVVPLHRMPNDFPLSAAAADIQARREAARKAREAKAGEKNTQEATEGGPQEPSEKVSEEATKETMASPKRRPGRPKGSKNTPPTIES